MSKPAIVVENLSKCYRLGQREKQHQSFREALSGMVTGPLRRLRALAERGTIEDTFWALRDVNFEVRPGEVVGMVGRNGAGKSTLLKVLSRIVEPTSGRIRLRGRVASLLEVGTGFHPELSGRENIYMNGSILGMRKAEIDRKFDEIVAFSEVEKFLDTPVKRYSSGMYVRLAFAVAAHLEPEILIVDEVLAVGDAEFQRKCLGKMQDVAGGGRTVLFVSHNLAAVQALCTRAVMLRQGRCEADGRPDVVIPQYLQAVRTSETSDLTGRRDRQGSGAVVGSDLAVRGVGGMTVTEVHCGEDVAVELKYQNTTGRDVGDVRVGLGIYDSYGRAMTFLQNVPLGVSLTARAGGGRIVCEVPKCRLAPGRYWINYEIRQGSELCDAIEQAAVFDVAEGDFFGTGKITYSTIGGILVEQRWSHQAIETTDTPTQQAPFKMHATQAAAI